MKLKLKKATATLIGLKDLEPFGVSKQSWAFRDDGDAFVNLPSLSLAQVDKLRQLLETKSTDRTVKNLLLNLVAYQLAATGEGLPKAKSCEQMATFLTQFLRPVDRHWVWQQERGTDRWLPYYVNRITYEAPDARRQTEPSVRVDLLLNPSAGSRRITCWLRPDDCRGRTAPEALTRKGYRWDDPNLQAAYDASWPGSMKSPRRSAGSSGRPGRGPTTGWTGTRKRATGTAGITGRNRLRPDLWTANLAG
jgi:hypothetical protein